MLLPELLTRQTPAPAAPPAETVLTVAHLSKSFGDNHVLRDFSLALRRGENVVVLGQDVTALDHAALDRLRAKVGFLFQSNALYDSMTVRDNLLFPLRRHWLAHGPAEEDALVRQALADVGLEHTAAMMPAELSGGMRKRIALARTLILRPDIILYDEPTTGLDPVTAREISHLIREVQQKYHTSALIISHDMSCVRLVADRVVLLLDGRCYVEGRYEELAAETDPKVHEFFA